MGDEGDSAFVKPVMESSQLAPINRVRVCIHRVRTRSTRHRRVLI